MCNPEPSSSWATRVRVMKCVHAVQLCACCICGSHSPSVGRRFFSRQAKPVLPLRKITNRQGLKNAQNSNCSSSNGFGPIWRRWRSCLQVRPRSCRPRSHNLRCPRIVVLFAVLFVDCDEWFCILLGSLPGARHAIVCISFFAWVRSGRWLSGCRGPSAFFVRILCFDFCILYALLQGDSCRTTLCVFLSTRVIQRMSERFTGVPSWKYRWMASVLSVTGFLFHLVVHSLSFRRSVLGSTTAVFLNHISRIEVTSRLFWSNSVGLREDFIFLPQLQ